MTRAMWTAPVISGSGNFGGGGYGVAEITNPTTTPSMNQILPFTFMIRLWRYRRLLYQQCWR